MATVDLVAEYDQEDPKKVTRSKQQILKDLYPNSNDIEAVKTMQQILQKYGHYKGKIDGLRGPLTSAALQSWDKAHPQQQLSKSITQIK